MKAFLLLFSFFYINLYAKNPFFIPLPFKEAIIEYNILGNHKGFETLYVKEYGKYQVIYQNKRQSFTGKKSKENYIIKTPKWIYTLKDNKKAIRVPNLRYLLYIRFKELSKKDQKQVLANLKKINYLPIKSTNFKIAKNYATINGIKCDLIIQNGKKECYGYKGSLLLKSKVKFLGFNKTKILFNIFETKTDPGLYDLSSFKIVDDKLKSVQLYELSAKIITKLKNKLPKNIFLNIKEKKALEDIIQEGIKKLEEI